MQIILALLTRECNNLSSLMRTQVWEGLDFQDRCNCYCHSTCEEVGRSQIQPISYNRQVSRSEVRYP
jgi:hypothetical protein